MPIRLASHPPENISGVKEHPLGVRDIHLDDLSFPKQEFLADIPQIDLRFCTGYARLTSANGKLGVAFRT